MKRIVMIFFGVALTALLLYYLGELYSPGSYGNAESYELNLGEAQLIELIEEFKAANPQFDVPREVQLSDHKNGPWYVIYFYYPNENEIIYTTTSASEKGKTTFALVSVKDAGMIGGWKDVNGDLNGAESAAQIERFETLILDHIKKKVDQD